MHTNRILISIFCFLSAINSFGQIKDIVSTDGITNPVHLANIGRITFMSGNIPLEQYKESDFLRSYELTRKSALNIRVFMDNSITNYLHRLAPELAPEVLVKNGNFQFSFFVDGHFIYKENLHYGAGVQKNTATTFRQPLTSITGEDWWMMYVWDRFMLNGGERSLGNDKHLLKLELRPYLKLPQDTAVKTGDLIASGELELKIVAPVVSKEQISIQPIAANADWKVSTDLFDKKIIEGLNTAIAKYELKDITSVVVIKDGKLLLEEYFNDANRTTLHDTRSACKSFTSTLMGIAIKEGYIKNENQTLNTFYDLQSFANYSKKKDSIKIRDLLTMSSAFNGSDAHSDSPGNEENMYPTDNWVKFTLDLPMDQSKINGRQWDYFTAGVILLGDILNKSVPGGLEKYADEKLFKPLHIINYQWQYTPQKVPNTAGTLQMSSLDFAKYAQLYKNNGAWDGKQLVPANWVNKTFTKQLFIPERNNEFYGFLFWNKTFHVKGKNYEAFYCAGNGGNEFIIFKDLPIVVIITSKAYNKPYGHPQAEKIVSEFVLPAVLK